MTWIHQAVLGGFGFTLGASIGSFLNVCVWRLPRGESLTRPPSRCPLCETPIAPRDNLPVLGWLILRGRCRQCSQPIALRYPLVEAAVGAAFAAVFLADLAAGPNDVFERGLGALGWLGYHLALVSALVTLAMIRFDELGASAAGSPPSRFHARGPLTVLAGIAVVLGIATGDHLGLVASTLAWLLPSCAFGASWKRPKPAH